MSVKVFIEIERLSNMKYEYNKEHKALELDRILPYPHVYPYAYGFVPNTLAADGDELDALIVCYDHSIRNDTTYDTHIVTALRMEDEHGIDDKLICTLDGAPVSDDVLAEIETFFATYKSNTPGSKRWSRTNGFMTKEEAVALYEASGSLALSYVG